jgi:F-type H+-transporting ATPase subunit a
MKRDERGHRAAPERGARVTSDREPQERQEPGTTSSSRLLSTRRSLLLLIAAVLIIDVLAVIVVPPFDKGDPDAPCEYPVCFIDGNLHLPAPNVVWTPDGGHGSSGMLIADVSLTDSLVTMIILTVLLLVTLVLLTRRRAAIPGRVQNLVEWAYEALDAFALGMGGARARRYVPLFASLFVLILTFNWSGLIPLVGRLEFLRAPSSDVNVTIGLALVSFCIFHIEGVRRLGAREYAGKFFPVYEFRNGIGAGIIALFVGLVELMLEFVKPLTLSMRLFGNIFGGEIALGVVTGLFIALIPVALYGLEIMLTFVQALIFSTLTLMFTLAAIESHHHEEGHMGEEAAHAMEEALVHRPATA